MIDNRALSEEEISCLWTEYQKTKNSDIRNKLVLHYIVLVKKIAYKIFRNYRCFDSLDELVSEGIVALINAIDRFDIERNVKFETFISYRIQGSMLDYINKQNGYVRKIYELSKQLFKAKEELTASLKREPTREEIADFLHISIEEYERNLLEIKPISMVSLDQVVVDSNMDEKQIEVSSGIKDDPAEILTCNEYSEVLAEGIKKLNEEQQLVLSLFYKEDLTVKEIADIINTDTQRVSQIRFQAIKRLKKLIEVKV